MHADTLTVCPHWAFSLAETNPVTNSSRLLVQALCQRPNASNRWKLAIVERKVIRAVTEAVARCHPSDPRCHREGLCGNQRRSVSTSMPWRRIQRHGCTCALPTERAAAETLPP